MIFYVTLNGVKDLSVISGKLVLLIRVFQLQNKKKKKHENTKYTKNTKE